METCTTWYKAAQSHPELSPLEWQKFCHFLFSQFENNSIIKAFYFSQSTLSLNTTFITALHCRTSHHCQLVSPNWRGLHIVIDKLTLQPKTHLHNPELTVLAEPSCLDCQWGQYWISDSTQQVMIAQLYAYLRNSPF
jgi:hypothetical protein